MKTCLSRKVTRQGKKVIDLFVVRVDGRTLHFWHGEVDEGSGVSPLLTKESISYSSESLATDGFNTLVGVKINEGYVSSPYPDDLREQTGSGPDEIRDLMITCRVKGGVTTDMLREAAAIARAVLESASSLGFTAEFVESDAGGFVWVHRPGENDPSDYMNHPFMFGFPPDSYLPRLPPKARQRFQSGDAIYGFINPKGLANVGLETRGTGADLGMRVVLAYCQRHGAQIEAEDTLGEGVVGVDGGGKLSKTEWAPLWSLFEPILREHHLLTGADALLSIELPDESEGDSMVGSLAF